MLVYIVIVALSIAVIYLAVRLRAAEKNIESLWRLQGKMPPAGSGRPLASILVVLASAAAALGQSEQAVASLDRSRFPVQDQWRQYYISTSACKTDLERQQLEIALRLLIPSTSQQRVLERCWPEKVSETLWRIDIGYPASGKDQLSYLGWDYATWRDLLASNPYYRQVASDGRPLDLVIRGDWLLVQIGDATESDAYYRLLFGGKKPKTSDDFMRALGVNLDPDYQFGMAEGKSAINTKGKRLIKNFDARRGAAWQTFDSLDINFAHDPLQQIVGQIPHDGEEGFVYLTKTYRKTGVQGTLPVFYLADGKGKIVAEANARLVHDYTNTRNSPVVRAPISCWSCHRGLLNPLKRNDVRYYLEKGVELWADYATAESVESFYFTNPDTEFRRTNEDCKAIAEIATGGASLDDATTCIVGAIGVYDQDVTADRAAHEFGKSPQEFTRAIAAANAYGVVLPARVAGLAHGLDAPRDAIEESAQQIQNLCDNWKGE